MNSALTWNPHTIEKRSPEGGLAKERRETCQSSWLTAHKTLKSIMIELNGWCQILTPPESCASSITPSATITWLPKQDQTLACWLHRYLRMHLHLSIQCPPLNPLTCQKTLLFSMTTPLSLRSITFSLDGRLTRSTLNLSVRDQL
jgi:hypothetical protein